MAKGDESSSINLAVVGLVALVAIVGLVALVLNASSLASLGAVSTGGSLVSAEEVGAEYAPDDSNLLGDGPKEMKDKMCTKCIAANGGGKAGRDLCKAAGKC